MILEADEIIWLPRGFEFLCGLPEPKRRNRQILTLQAFIDDSGSKGTGRAMLLAGLFGTAEALVSMADAWERELRSRTPLPIRYFKADEARNLRGEFSDWRRKGRDEKVRRLAAVIDRDDLVMVHTAVDLSSHRTMENYVGKLSDAKRHPMNQPYLFALLSVMLACGLEAWHRKHEGRVEVIFDDHLIYRNDAKAQYRILREEIAPEWLRRYLPLEPFFRDDKDFVVLQAADLLAGHGRMLAERVSRWPRLEWQRLNSSPFSRNYTAPELAKLTVKQLARQTAIPERAFRVVYQREPFGSERQK